MENAFRNSFFNCSNDRVYLTDNLVDHCWACPARKSGKTLHLVILFHSCNTATATKCCRCASLGPPFPNIPKTMVIRTLVALVAFGVPQIEETPLGELPLAPLLPSSALAPFLRGI